MRFATSDLPGDLSDAERAAAWTEALGAAGGQFDMRAPRTEGFFGAVEIKVFGDLQIGSALTSSADLVRSPDRIARDGDDRVLLVVNRGGSEMQAVQFGRVIDFPPGGMALYDMARSLECHALAGGHIVHALVPRRAFADLDLEAICAVPLDGRGETARLLRDLVSDLLRRELETAGVIEATIAYLAALIRAACEAQGAHPDRTQAINRFRLRKARALIADRFSDPRFSIAEVADRLGVSTRHLQSLFAAEGDSFSQILAAHRLDAAYVALRAGPGQAATVADIAYRCGYGDLSTFYRRFSARYGSAPATVRKAALALGKSSAVAP